MMTRKVLVLDVSESDIEAVIRDFERANPGKSARDMSPKDFADRMMEKIKATAKMMPLKEALR